MANQEVKIFFKVEGIDGYITDLDDLQKALSGADKDTKDLSKSTDTLTKETEKSVTSINSLNDELNKLQKELNETEVGSEAFTELQGKVKDAEEALKSAKTGQQGFTDAIAAAPGPVGALGQSVKGVSAAFKALLANPVILVISGIVAVVTALFKAFTSTKEGGEALDRVMAGLSAAFDVFRDLLVEVSKPLIKLFTDPKQALIDFGNSIKQNIINRFTGILELIPNLAKSVKLVFEGEFSEAAETAGNALLKVTTGVEDGITKIKEVGQEVANEANEAARLTGILQDITDRERDLNVVRAEQNKLLAEAKLRADDQTLSIEERQAAVEEAARLEQDVLNQQLQLEKERLVALEALAAQSDSDAETLDELAAQRIKLAQLEEQSLNKQTEIQGKRRALTNEQAAADKAAADAAAAKRKEEEDAAAAQLQRETELFEELRRSRLNERELELDDLRLKYEADVKAAGDNKDLLLQLEEKFNQDKLDVNKKFDDEEKKLEEDTQKSIQDILDGYAEQQYANEQERILAELALQYDADRLKLEQAGATADQLAALDKAYQDKVTAQTKKGEDDRAKLRKESALQGVQLFSDVLGAFQELNSARTANDEKEAKRQFENNKKFSIAQALISTGLAVNAALTAGGNPIKLATGAQFVEAGIALATGLAQVAKIRATEFNGGSAGGGSVEQPTFNPQAAIDTRNQQLGGLQNAGEEINLGGTTPQPIKAYVVSTEVQSGLEANAQIENLSRL